MSHRSGLGEPTNCQKRGVEAGLPSSPSQQWIQTSRLVWGPVEFGCSRVCKKDKMQRAEEAEKEQM